MNKVLHIGICALSCALIATVLPVLASCGGGQQNTEEKAAQLLNEARTALASKQYSDARSSILHLRKQYPTAFEARRAAILTLDSVEMLEARDSIAIYEPMVAEARERLTTLADNPRGTADSAYIAQRILVYQMEECYDALCTKVKFFERKLKEDR